MAAVKLHKNFFPKWHSHPCDCILNLPSLRLGNPTKLTLCNFKKKMHIIPVYWFCTVHSNSHYALDIKF